jgi:hypothetical protein
MEDHRTGETAEGVIRGEVIMSSQNKVVQEYLRAYRRLIVSERTEEGGREVITLSFPFHYSGNHRIEVTVSPVNGGQFLISDQARTLSELGDSGYRVTDELRAKVEDIADKFGVRLVKDYLLLDCVAGDLGKSIQQFVEAAKTVGDVYLVHRSRTPQSTKIIRQLRDFLDRRHVAYLPSAHIPGKIESHSVDLYLPPNGRPGLALAVLVAQNTHILAQAWGYRCDDIRAAATNQKLKIGLVIDEESGIWSKESRAILVNRADYFGTKRELPLFERKLESEGIVA